MTNRDWGGLRGILDEAKQIAEEQRQHVSPDCPVCGEPLQVNSRGERNCVYAHYRDNGTPVGGRT